MNYLAHFHLSHGNNDLLLGALLGDFVKGPLKSVQHDGVEQGILLHRKIDAFTDNHQQLRELQLQFDPSFRRYAGIMTDVAFDHFLNKHWQQFHPQPLHDFSQEVFTLLTNNHQLTPAAKHQADNLSRHNVFVIYRHWQTVEGALSRISQRLSRQNPLADAAGEMEKHYPQLEQVFLDFYPQLQQHVRTIRQTLDK